MDFIASLQQNITISDEVRRFLVDECVTKNYKKGELVSTEGAMNYNVYFVEKGLLRSYYNEDGKIVTANFFYEGKIMANVGTIFKNEPSNYAYEALEDSVLTQCDYRKLSKLSHISKEISNLSLEILGNVIFQLATRINTLQHLSAKEKYKQLMDDNPNIILRAPLGMVASYLGISQETLSRIRAER